MRYLRWKVLAIPKAILKKYRRYSIGNTSVSDVNNPGKSNDKNSNIVIIVTHTLTI